MNEYQKRYADLQKRYFAKDGEASVILGLYELKDELEKLDEKAAKLVLVDVYELLNFKKSAYELLLGVADKSDKKQLKQLGYLKQFVQSHGDKFAVPRPKSVKPGALNEKPKAGQGAESNTNSGDVSTKQTQRQLPKFRYHPNPLATGAFKNDMSVVCECCGEPTDVYYRGAYCVADVKYLCPWCIADGSAAAKFKATFIQDADVLLEDVAKTKELFERTPGFVSWQGEHWLVCCDDYCEFLGDVGTKELQDLGVADEVFAEYDARGEYKDAREYLTAGGSMAGYLFRCLRCGKYHIYVDAD